MQLVYVPRHNDNCHAQGGAGGVLFSRAGQRTRQAQRRPIWPLALGLLTYYASKYE